MISSFSFDFFALLLSFALADDFRRSGFGGAFGWDCLLDWDRLLFFDLEVSVRAGESINFLGFRRENSSTAGGFDGSADDFRFGAAFFAGTAFFCCNFVFFVGGLIFSVSNSPASSLLDGVEARLITDCGDRAGAGIAGIGSDFFGSTLACPTLVPSSLCDNASFFSVCSIRSDNETALFPPGVDAFNIPAPGVDELTFIENPLSDFSDLSPRRVDVSNIANGSTG
jgi:hypothetical protein